MPETGMIAYGPARSDKKGRKMADMKLLKGQTSFLTLLVVILTVIAISLIIINRLDEEIGRLEADRASVNLVLLEKQQEKSRNTDELGRKDTEKYIVELAREEYGYMYKGEIRYIITNPELLYD